MSRRGSPRPFGEAVRAAVEGTAPRTPLAAIQAAWPRAVGDAIAAEAEPVSEREGVVTVACRSATWAQELDLMQDELRARVNAEAAAHGDWLADQPVRRLRFTADAARGVPPDSQFRA